MGAESVSMCAVRLAKVFLHGFFEYPLLGCDYQVDGYIAVSVAVRVTFILDQSNLVTG